ncbi:MAG TPA: YraN family protein [Stellaceae bacterium]|nr:YraN family protein [Stellaceae bacterium]
MSAPTDRRRRAERRGRWAESLCVWSLRLRGYRILARDYRVAVGEVDILARRGGTLVAIEVKARGDRASASEAVTPRQRRRITRAAAHFLSGRPDLARLTLRFDVMLVVPRQLPLHVRDAWREGDG